MELRFDPEDLTLLEVYWEGHPAGQAIPFILGRHVHRQVPQAQPPAPPAPTGVDYLRLVLAAHDADQCDEPLDERLADQDFLCSAHVVFSLRSEHWPVHEKV